MIPLWKQLYFVWYKNTFAKELFILYEDNNKKTDNYASVSLIAVKEMKILLNSNWKNMYIVIGIQYFCFSFLSQVKGISRQLVWIKRNNKVHSIRLSHFLSPLLLIRSEAMKFQIKYFYNMQIGIQYPHVSFHVYHINFRIPTHLALMPFVSRHSLQFHTHSCVFVGGSSSAVAWQFFLIRFGF